MPILVDTSVWSLVLRRKKRPSHPAITILEELLQGSEPIFVLDIIVQEILEGIKDDLFFRKIQKELEIFPSLALSRNIYVMGAKLFNLCRRHGVATTTIDCLIAAAAIEYRCLLFTLDRDFEYIARHTPLELFKNK
jgi:predicted nucleic acid-binding protein